MAETMLAADQLGNTLMQHIIAWIPQLEQLTPWAFFGVMSLAAIVLSQLVGALFKWIVKAITSKTNTKADDILIGAIQQPLAWLVFSLLLYVAIAPLKLENGFDVLVKNLLAAVNIALVAWLLHRIVKTLLEVWKDFASKTESELDDAILPIVSKFLKATIWILALLMILSSWGIQIGPFLAGLGIAGIAIGFAVQDSLSNIFGGISLALDKAYRVGDKVKLGDGTVGVVHDITLRSTRVRTYDGDLVMIPNGKISNDNIYTYAQPGPKSRGQVNFGVEYGSDAKKVKQVILETLNKIEKVSKDPEPSVAFISMGDFSLNFRAYFWLDDYNDVWGTEREATEAIYEALNNSGIGIPFPTHTIHMNK